MFLVSFWLGGFLPPHRPSATSGQIADLYNARTVLVIWSVEVQMFWIAAAVLMDNRRAPILPRWVGYLSLWAAILIIPAGLILFFKTGPWACNGIVGFFVPLTGLVAWLLSMTWTVHKALAKQIAEGTGPE